MTMPVLRINPKVQAGTARATYLREGLVQIPDIFEPELADYLARLIEDMTLDLAFQGEDGRPALLTVAEQEAAGPALAARVQGVIERTGYDYGFLYQSYAMITAYLNGRDPGHPIHKLTEWLNGEFLQFGAYVTNQPQIARADGQLTRYRPGDFIGLHNDVGTETTERLTAYTLGLTRDWRTDWGGQLLFHDDKGDVLRGYIPRFNTLTLFKVPQLHSVAPVAPYAKTPRHSVVGWLRN